MSDSPQLLTFSTLLDLTSRTRPSCWVSRTGAEQLRMGIYSPVIMLTAVSRPSSPRGYGYYLFVPARDRHDLLWNGERTGVEGAVEIFGADEVRLDSRNAHARHSPIASSGPCYRGTYPPLGRYTLLSHLHHPPHRPLNHSRHHHPGGDHHYSNSSRQQNQKSQYSRAETHHISCWLRHLCPSMPNRSNGRYRRCEYANRLRRFNSWPARRISPAEPIAR